MPSDYIDLCDEKYYTTLSLKFQWFFKISLVDKQKKEKGL